MQKPAVKAGLVLAVFDANGLAGRLSHKIGFIDGIDAFAFVLRHFFVIGTGHAAARELIEA